MHPSLNTECLLYLLVGVDHASLQGPSGILSLHVWAGLKSTTHSTPAHVGGE
jgi:hypothetical protein